MRNSARAELGSFSKQRKPCQDPDIGLNLSFPPREPATAAEVSHNHPRESHQTTQELAFSLLHNAKLMPKQNINLLN